MTSSFVRASGRVVILINFFGRRLSSFCGSKMIRTPEEPIKTYLKQAKCYVPGLNSELRKGECGRIGVVGGSLLYSGAPYFAAMASMKIGADLSFVICCREAATAIKSYSPDLVVIPYLDDPEIIERVKSCLEKLSALVIGPGMGRETVVMKNTEEIIEHCNAHLESPPPLIIDADGLHLVGQKPELIQNYKGLVVLTPNAGEYAKLCREMGIPVSRPSHLARTLNVILIQKGLVDTITNGLYQDVLKSPDHVITISLKTDCSLRRCGGQGDILAGCTAAFIGWAVSVRCKNNYRSFTDLFVINDSDTVSIENETEEGRERIYRNRYECYSLACLAACMVTKHSSFVAYNKHGRSMVASDIIPCLHNSFITYFGG